MASVCCICLTKAGEVKCRNEKCEEKLCVACHSQYMDKCPVCTVPRGYRAPCLVNDDTQAMKKAWNHYGFKISASMTKVHVHLYKKLILGADAARFLPEEKKLESAFAMITILLQTDVPVHSYVKFTGEPVNMFVASRTATAIVSVALTYKNETIYGTFV